jgi:hypothetical protein
MMGDQVTLIKQFYRIPVGRCDQVLGGMNAAEQA